MKKKMDQSSNQEQEQEQENALGMASSFLAGLLLGGLAGATAMLLTAPQSGKQTRSKIKYTGLALRDQTTDAMEDAVAQVRGKAHRINVRARKQAKKLEQRGQAVIDAQKKRWSAAW